MIEENGLVILNRNMASDEKREWTFIGKIGCSILDYAITEVEIWKKISKFKIEERTKSDHHTIEIEIKVKSE